MGAVRIGGFYTFMRSEKQLRGGGMVGVDFSEKTVIFGIFHIKWKFFSSINSKYTRKTLRFSKFDYENWNWSRKQNYNPSKFSQ